MFDFLIGLALGTAFAPFWMKVWALVSPKLVALFKKVTGGSTPPTPPAA